MSEPRKFHTIFRSETKISHVTFAFGGAAFGLHPVNGAPTLIARSSTAPPEPSFARAEKFPTRRQSPADRNFHPGSLLRKLESSDGLTRKPSGPFPGKLNV